MADVAVQRRRGEVIDITANTRYLLGGFHGQKAAKCLLQVDVSTACAYDFQADAGLGYVACAAHPVNDPNNPVTSGSTSKVYDIEAGGKQIAFNIGAITGTPKFIFHFIDEAGG
jgi:hypothetical protein